MSKTVVDLVEETTSNMNSPSSTAMEIDQDSSLLNLPLEVLQNVMYHMDAATFFISLLVCKDFLKAAGCRGNLLRHIYNIPGPRLGLEDYSTSDLLLQFRKRAAESGCAAGILADVTRYEQTSKTSLSSGAFSPGNLPESDRQAYIATVHDGYIVQIYGLGRHHVRLKAELHIRPEDDDDRRMEIRRMAFSSSTRDLAVLYRQRPNASKLPRVTAVPKFEPPGRCSYKLVVFYHLFAKTKGYFYDSHQQETRNITAAADPDVEGPVGLALAANGNACVAWKSPANVPSTGISLIGRDAKLMDACSYDPKPDILSIQDPPELPPNVAKSRQVFGLQFVANDNKLNLYRPGNPIHSWYTTSPNPAKEHHNAFILHNGARIGFDSNSPFSSTEMEVGMPFHGLHSEDITLEGQSETFCQFSYLALGIDKYPSDKGKSDYHPDAFIVQADMHVPSSNCAHRVHLDNGRLLDMWTSVGLLAGWRQGTSSLGTVLAISPQGGRIAAATWSRVLVWSFDARLLHQGELQHYYPTRDYNEGKKLGRIRPTLLPSAGIVHNMLWIDQTQLYATTDQGLIRWDIGPMSDGEKEELTLTYDAWPETAVARPARPAMPDRLKNKSWSLG